MPLEARLGILLSVGIAGYVGQTVDDHDVQAEVLCTLLGNGQPEEPRADNNKIRFHTLSLGPDTDVRLPEQAFGTA